MAAEAFEGVCTDLPAHQKEIMTQDEQKQAVARAARDYVAANIGASAIIGVGTGSTANFFIDELAAIKHRLAGAVASSAATQKGLEGHGIRVPRSQRGRGNCRSMSTAPMRSTPA